MAGPEHTAETVAVFDLDGTITRRDTYTGILLHGLYRNPRRIPRLAPLTLPVVRFALGRLDNAVMKERLLKAVFAGLPETRLRELTRSFVERLLARGMRNPAVAALQRHRDSGHRTVLLSASPDFYVQDIADRLGFDHCICTRTARGPDGVLTGELAGANCRGEEKITRLFQHFGGDRGQYHFIGYGDRETDFPLLRALDQGIVVSPGRRTRDRALAAGLQVVDW
jgi:HAD superfamily hydrolase (TIGR01490 family)